MCGCCAPPADRITPVVNAENITISGNEIRNCNAGSGIAVFNSRHPRVSNNRIFHPFSNPAAIGRLDVSSRLDFSGKELSGEEISRLRESYSAILFLGSDAIECRHNSLTDPGTALPDDRIRRARLFRLRRTDRCGSRPWPLSF